MSQDKPGTCPPAGTTADITGIGLSRFAAGMMRLLDWGMDDLQLYGFMSQLLDLGVSTVDLADIYGDYGVEVRFGQVLRQYPALRQRIQLVSKCGIRPVSPGRPAHRIKHYDTSSAHIIASVEQSLQDLHSDHLDLLLIHRPDPLMNADEVAGAFRRLQEQGKVLHFGVSNFLPHQCELLQSRLEFPLVCNQIEFSPAQLAPLHDGTLDYCQQNRLLPMIWSPLSGGRLLDTRRTEFKALQNVLITIGANHEGAAPDQIIYAWILQHPARPLPVVGSGRIERYSAAVAAENIALDREEWFSIYRAVTGSDVA